MRMVGVTSGLRGYYTVLYDNDGPIQSGVGSYTSYDDAAIEAREWAAAEGIEFDDDRQGIPRERSNGWGR